jgi:LPS sulfotransferase NodH
LPNWGETAHIEQYAAWLFQDRSTPNGVFGAKIMPGQFRDLCAMTTPRRAGRNPHAGLQSIFPGLRYVWMRRRDKLRQAISYVRADQTGQWFQREGGVHLPRPKPRFDQEAIDLRLREIESEERQWLNFFDISRVTPVTVVYEDLAYDYEATAKRTLKQLGISLPRQLWFGQRQLLRQADGRTDDWVRRFKASVKD